DRGRRAGSRPARRAPAADHLRARRGPPPIRVAVLSQHPAETIDDRAAFPTGPAPVQATPQPTARSAAPPGRPRRTPPPPQPGRPLAGAGGLLPADLHAASLPPPRRQHPARLTPVADRTWSISPLWPATKRKTAGRRGHGWPGSPTGSPSPRSAW